MSVTPKVSVIIRCKNEATDIGGVLCGLFSQQVDFAFEVIAVDSGSTDGTLDILKNFPVRVIHIAPESFSFGGALNTGCQAAKGEILLSLSAHVYPCSRLWLARHVRHFSNKQVAATCLGTSLLYQDRKAFEARPFEGYDNANGAFRAALWQERPFDEELTGTEDKEWAYHFQKAGHIVVCDPELAVIHEHFTAGTMDMIRDRYIRSYREYVAYVAFMPRWRLFVSLFRRMLDRGVPRNRESLAWYVGACMGMLRG